MRWNRRYLLSLVAFLGAAGFPWLLLRAAAAVETESLIVFVQPEASAVDDTFQQKVLPEIRTIAREMNVSVHRIDARQGAPEDVALTPLVVYQNHKGRSIYQGRTTTTDRIRNFIRTSRFIPQGAEPNSRTDIPVWPMGRTRVWAPLKIAPVTGTPPEDYDHASFRSRMQEALAEGFSHFSFQAEGTFGRADRAFYMDFYPWLSEDGTLFLSLALYSEFHCKEPVFEKKKKPLVGPWKERSRLFAEAAAIMEAAVERAVRDPSKGDGFDALHERVPAVGWEEIGFPLPPAPEKSRNLPDSLAALPTSWALDAASSEEPMVLFRFPAPLDNYSGEAFRVKGEIRFPEDRTVAGTGGFVEVDPASITMGVPDLDEVLHGSMFLHTRRFPTAGFTVGRVTADERPLAYGRMTTANVAGTFFLKGKKVPLSLPMELEPVVGEDGAPLLLARGRFRIDLRTYDIEGAEGPAPARHTVQVDLNLRFRAIRL